jgi:putative ABC transport system permease protein
MKHAVRSLLQSPGFTVTALLTLALGIGVNTSMFSVLNTLMLRRLAYPDEQRIVRVYRTSPQSQAWPHSPANFLDHAAQNEVFERMAAFRWAGVSFVESGQPAQRVPGMLVTADFFSILGAPPLLGRTFTAGEDKAGATKVVVLSHAAWLNRFGGDRDVIGRTVRLNSEPVTVIGVMPPSFDDAMLWGKVEVWRPMAFTDEQRTTRDSNYLNVIAKLKPGVSPTRAQAGMTALAAKLAHDFPVTNSGQGLRVLGLAASAQDDSDRQLIWFIMGLAGFVLLIACANLANLQFARTAGRTREYAIRTALGASRVRIIRDLLTESLLLGLAGGTLGLVVALWCNDTLSHNIRIGNDVGALVLPVDFRVLGFALAASVGTGLAFGLLPAWFASRANVSDALKQGARGSSASPTQSRLRHALIVAELALALTLLAGAAFFTRGVQRFAQRDPGWNPDGVLTAYVSLPGSKYTNDDQRRAFTEQVEAKLAALPGVTQASVSSDVPTWGYGSSTGIIVEGRPVPPAGQELLAYNPSVSPSYFQNLGLHFVAGRNFAPTDRPGAPDVVVVNAAMARALWPGENPVGKRIGSPGKTPNWREVIGVVNDVHAIGNPAAHADTPFQFYRPAAQAPFGFHVVALRSHGAPELLANELRRAVAAIDADQPVHEIHTIRQEVQRTAANMTTVSFMLGAFSALGVTLAALGIYGVIAGFVVQRTNEIGIRMALGAQLRDILGLVLGRGLRLALLGIALGLAGAYGIAQLLHAIAPAIPDAEASAVFGITALLLVVATFACWLPARRATQVDPVAALRAE